jgi:hypothetical protein
MAGMPPPADLAACKRMFDALRQAHERLTARVRTETGVCVVTAEWVDECGETVSKTFRQAGLGGAPHPPAAARIIKRARQDGGPRSTAWVDFVRSREFGMDAFVVGQLGSHEACARLCELLRSQQAPKKNWPQALYWMYFNEHMNALERRELEAEAAKPRDRRSANELVPTFATFAAWRRDVLARLSSQASETAEASVVDEGGAS